MVKSAVRVVLRTRPTAHFNADAIKISPGGDEVELKISRSHVNTSADTAERYRFRFDGVLHEATQEDVFSVCAEDTIDAFMQGFNATVLCYGQTGAGKTYTMLGGRDSYKSRGLVPRCISRVFEEIRRSPDLTRTVRMSYVEIYNEHIYDLLNPAQDPGAIQIADGPRGSVLVRGVSCPVVMTEQDALQLMFEGEENRAIAEHQLNTMSSRSHAVVTLYLETRRSPVDPQSITSKMHLIDLAGSERLRKTKSSGTVAKEATFINKSLSFLEQVVVALGDRTRDHVPYRSSKLTHMLKDSLGGNSKTLMVANVWGDPDHLDETLSTCRFAQRMMRVSCDVVQNVAEDTTALARALQAQVAQLKEELAMYDAMSNRAGVTYDPYTADQKQQLKAQVLEFFTNTNADVSMGSIEPLQFLSVRHMTETLLVCRELYQEARGGRGEGPVGVGAATVGSSDRAPASNSPLRNNQDGDGGDEGDGDGDRAEGATLERSGGGEGEGVDARGGGEGEESGEGSVDGRMVAPAESRPAQPGPRPSRAVAFEEFSRGPGAELSLALQHNKAALRDCKTAAKAAGMRVNEAKRAIDACKARVEELRGARGDKGEGDGEGEASVMGEDEYRALVELRDMKAAYKARFQEMQSAKAEAEYVGKLAEQCTKELILAFDAWFLATYGPEPETANASPGDGSGDEGNWVVPGTGTAVRLGMGAGGVTGGVASVTMSSGGSGRGEGEERGSEGGAGTAGRSETGGGRGAAALRGRGRGAGVTGVTGGASAGAGGTGVKRGTPKKAKGAEVAVPEDEKDDPEAQGFWNARKQLQRKMEAGAVQFHKGNRHWG